MNELELLKKCKPVADLPPIKGKWDKLWETLTENEQLLFHTGDKLRQFYKNHGYKLDLIQNANPTSQTVTKSERIVDGKIVTVKSIRTTSRTQKLPPVDYIKEIRKALQEMTPPTYKVIKHDKNSDGVDLVIPIADFHYGKRGLDYTSLKAERLLFKLVDGVLSKTSHLKINNIYVFVLGDFLHYDTMGKTTTKGTPQDTDLQPNEMDRNAIRILGSLLLKLSKYAKVQLSQIAGNHDERTSMLLRYAMGFAFRDNANIKVTTGSPYREYIKVNKTVFAITHDIKLDKARVSMNTEAKQLNGKNERFIWLLGHLHNASQVGDYGDMEIWRQPAFCGEDHWTNKEGYKSTKFLQCYVVNADNEIDTFTAKE
jgi:hypothetical protein